MCIRDSLTIADMNMKCLGLLGNILNKQKLCQKFVEHCYHSFWLWFACSLLSLLGDISFNYTYTKQRMKRPDKYGHNCQ